MIQTAILMMNSKLFWWIAAVIFALSLLFTFIIKPHYDLKEAKAEIIIQKKDIAVILYGGTKEVFETKYSTLKNALTQKEKPHEDIKIHDLNLTVGFHSTIFE